MEIFKNTSIIRWTRLAKFIEDHGDVIITKQDKKYVVYPRGFYNKAIIL